MLFFVEICVNNPFYLFIFFPVFALTVFQSWFLSDVNLVFFLAIILIKFSRIISSSYVRACSVWIWCVSCFDCYYFVVNFC